MSKIAWTIKSPCFRTHNLRGQGAARVNRICVPQHQRRTRIVNLTIESAHPQMFAIARNRNSFDGADRWDCASNIDQEVNDGAAACKVP